MTGIDKLAADLAARMAGQPDLYAVLRAGAAGLDAAGAGALLAALHRALAGRAEAARILLGGDGATELICGAMAYDPGLRPKDAAALGVAVAKRLGEGR